MKNKIKQTSWTNRFIFVSLLLLTMTNPWSVGYIGTAVDTAVVYFTLYANYVFVAGLVLMCVVNLYTMYAGRERVSVPKKTTQKPAKSNMKYELTN